MAVRSKLAGKMLADLLDEPPIVRNAWLLDLDDRDFLEVTRAAGDHLGTPFGLWQDDFRGFVEIGLGGTLYDVQDEIGLSLVENERTAVPSCHDAGKALTLDTPLPTPDGWSMMGDLLAGDQLYDETGKVCSISRTGPVHDQPTYRVRFDDGATIDAAGRHEWIVLGARRRATFRQANRPTIITDWRDHWTIGDTVETADLGELTTGQLGRRWAIPTCRPLAGDGWPLAVPPYTLGIWLGDGHTDSSAFTAGHNDGEQICADIRAEGVTLRERRSQRNEGSTAWGMIDGTLDDLRSDGVLGAKHIPEAAFRASIENRLALMQGLIDSDGYRCRRGDAYEIALTCRRLADGVADLSRSLGWKTHTSTGRSTLNGIDHGPVYRTRFVPDRDPARLPRKRLGAVLPQAARRTIRTIVDVEPLGVRPVRCVEVDSPSHLFLAGRSMIPTHNSFLAARAVAWWICVWPPGTARAITTASRWRQVRNQLWPHIRFVHARGHLPGVCLQTEWQVGDLNYPAAYGLSPDDYDETAFSGIHDPHVLAVVDEAGGLSPVLGQSLESLMSGEHARMLLIGNPPMDETGSPWFEERCSRPTYHVIRLPAFKTPNFTGKATPLCKVHPDMPEHPISQHLVSRRWVDGVVADYGEDDPYYVARVLAEFPKDVTGKAIPRTWLEDAQANEDPVRSRWIRLGVDVAADGGDELAIARADGYVLKIVKSSRGAANKEPHDVAGMILEQIEEAEVVRRRVQSKRPVRVKIDAIGVGWGIAGILRAWKSEGRHHAEIVSVSVGKKCRLPDTQEKFVNQRAEMWWLGRTLSQTRRDDQNEPVAPTWKLDVSDTEVMQLAGPKYGRSSDGRIKIETKDEMRKRGVGSPDRGEALLLAMYEPGGGGRGKVSSTSARLPDPSTG